MYKRIAAVTQLGFLAVVGTIKRWEMALVSVTGMVVSVLWRKARGICVENGALREGGMANYVLGLLVCLSRAISTQSV